MKNNLILIAGIGLGLVGLAWFAKRQVVAVAKAVNPVDPNNVFAKSADSIGAQLTGTREFNLGDWTFCKLNPNSTLEKCRQYK